MPEECASIRSIARWVLPVLVGPSTAVTPEPRARSSRSALGENEIDIEARLRRYHAGKVALSITTAAVESPVLNVWNESGTNRGRIGDSAAVRLRSLRYMAPSTMLHTRSGGIRDRGGLSRPAQNAVRLANRILTRVKSPRAVENGDPWREAASGPSLRFGDRMRLQRRLGNRDKFRCAQQSDADRRRHRKAEGNNHARADDRRQPDFGVAQGHQILDRRAVRHVAGNRGEIDRADSRGSLITAVSLDSFHAPEFAVQIVANAAVEYCHLAIAGFRRDRIAAAADTIEHRGHRIEHATAVGVGDRDAIRHRRQWRLDHVIGDIARRERHPYVIDLAVIAQRRPISGRHRLAGADRAACRAGAAAAGKEPYDAGGGAARRGRIGVIG